MKHLSKKEKLLIIIIIAIVGCYITNHWLTDLSNSYLQGSRIARRAEENFFSLALERENSALLSMEWANSQMEWGIIEFIHWSKTGDLTHYEKAISFVNKSNKCLGESNEDFKNANSNLRESMVYANKSIQNEIAFLKINSGLNLMQMSPLLFSLALVALSFNGKNQKDRWSKGINISIFLLGLGIYTWLYGLIHIALNFHI